MIHILLKLVMVVILPLAMPEIQYPDIYNYLINTPSPYTKEKFKAYKCMEGYKYLIAGWVGDMSLHTASDKAVIKVKVKMFLRQPSVHGWL